MARILVLRETGSAARTMTALAAHGHGGLSLPLHEIRPLDPRPPGGLLAGLVVTSAHAAPWLARHFGDSRLPVVAVGEGTAAALRTSGLREIRIGAHRAASLPPMLAGLGARVDRPVLYAAGRVRRPDLESGCARRGVPLVVAEVYDTLARTIGSDELAGVTAGGAPDGVLLLSGEQARAFAELAMRHPRLLAPGATLHCLSEAIAEALPEAMRAQAQVARSPEIDRLIAAIV